MCTETNAGDVNQCHPIGRDAERLQHAPAAAVADDAPDHDPGHAAAPHQFADPNKPPVLPIVNVVVGVDFRLPQVRGWEARLEGGFYDAFFLGGAVGYTF